LSLFTWIKGGRLRARKFDAASALKNTLNRRQGDLRLGLEVGVERTRKNCKVCPHLQEPLVLRDGEKHR